MHDLAPLTPLGSDACRTDAIGRVRITEVTDQALASVACRRDQSGPFLEVAKRHFGVAPPAPGRAVRGPVYGLIWTGPEQWLADAPLDSHEDIARVVKSALGETASVTEQTDAWARFDVEGQSVLDLLERSCAAPSRRMADGDATRTVIDHVGCFLICRESGLRFSLLCPRSFAGSLHHALCAIARSIA